MTSKSTYAIQSSAYVDSVALGKKASGKPQSMEWVMVTMTLKELASDSASRVKNFLWRIAFAIAGGIYAVTFVICMVAIVSIVVAVPVYFLWNVLMPEIFGVRTITYWQALGLTWLAHILFKDVSSPRK